MDIWNLNLKWNPKWSILCFIFFLHSNFECFQTRKPETGFKGLFESITTESSPNPMSGWKKARMNTCIVCWASYQRKIKSNHFILHIHPALKQLDSKSLCTWITAESTLNHCSLKGHYFLWSVEPENEIKLYFNSLCHICSALILFEIETWFQDPR